DDWDALEQIWDHIFESALRVNPAEHPLLVTESAWNKRECRERLAELAFEKYRAPALFLCKDAVLTAFAAGRSTALVVDAGAGSTRVVPVYDGYVMQKNVAKQSLGAHMLSEIILQQMETDMKITVTPQYKVKEKQPVETEQPAKATLHDRPNTTASYDHYAKLCVVEDYKESACQVFEAMWDETSTGSTFGRPMSVEKPVPSMSFGQTTGMDTNKPVFGGFSPSSNNGPAGGTTAPAAGGAAAFSFGTADYIPPPPLLLLLDS
ncbi:actin-domain-containing protein, partial [Syncephalis pseudoplumigaleata]